MGRKLLLVVVVLAVTVSAVVVPAGAQQAGPARPSGLAVVSVAHDAVSLSWDDPADASVTHYQVLRRDRDVDAPGVFATVESDTGSAATSYVDATVEPERRYVYRVVAVGSTGSSPRSGYVRADTPSEPEEPTLVPVPEPDFALQNVQEIAGSFAHNESLDIDLSAMALPIPARRLVEGLWSDGDAWYILVDGHNHGEAVVAYDADTLTRVDELGFDIRAETPQNWLPRGLWSDGETFWIPGIAGQKVYTYSAAEAYYGEYLGTDARFNLPGTDESWHAPSGFWTDGAVFWVLGTGRYRVSAYDYETGARLESRDIDLSDVPSYDPLGLWSDGHTMWVADRQARGSRLLAFDLATGVRQPDLEFNTLTDAGITWPSDIWSDGLTMWVLSDTHKVHAFNMASPLRLVSVAASDVNLGQKSSTEHAGRVARGVSQVTVTATAAGSDATVSFGTADADTTAEGHQWDLAMGDNSLTVTVASGTETQDHTVSVRRLDVDALSDDSSVASLAVDGSAVDGFASDVTSYRLRVPNSSETVTVAATASVAASEIIVEPADCDEDADGHQVALTEGAIDVAVVRVLASDGVTETFYRLHISREPRPFERDLYMEPRGIENESLLAITDAWSDGQTWWVSFAPSTVRRNSGSEIRAYDVARGARDATKDIDLVGTNSEPQGLWSAGDKMLVGNSLASSDVLTYSLADGSFGSHESTRALTDIDSGSLRGLWSDGNTLWAVDSGDDAILAYSLDTGARLPASDLGPLDPANSAPRDLWIHGGVVWVLNGGNKHIYAYAAATMTRLPDLEFSTLDAAGNDSPLGIFSDGRTMWVADYYDNRVYAYVMPKFGILESVTVTGAELEPVSFGHYRGRVARASSTVTIEATAADSSHTVSYSALDADDVAPGHQWDLDIGENTMTVTVTVTADSVSQDSTITVTRLDVGELSDDSSLTSLSVSGAAMDTFSPEEFSYSAVAEALTNTVTVAALAAHADATVTVTPDDADLDTAGHQVSLVADDTLITVEVVSSDTTNRTTYSVTVASTPQLAMDQVPKLATQIALASANGRPVGTWADGNTIWVADTDDDKLYAYNLVTGAHDGDKDITLSDGNRDPSAIWSDDTTIWVSDTSDAKLYAYALATGTRDSGSDIALGSDNRSPAAIWSDKTTMWVANLWTLVVQAYELSSGNRDSSKDIGTLASAGIYWPSAMWSDGTTLWVLDFTSYRIYAFELVTGIPKPAFDLDALEERDNMHPTGLWSDGTTFWVADNFDDIIYTFEAPELPSG